MQSASPSISITWSICHAVTLIAMSNNQLIEDKLIVPELAAACLVNKHLPYCSTVWACESQQYEREGQ